MSYKVTLQDHYVLRGGHEVNVIIDAVTSWSRHTTPKVWPRSHQRPN